ncbi:MAG TPA: MlaD family protein [Solirubrobacteraceae bacterium]|jgi:virulence factor Mce-like protein
MTMRAILIAGGAGRRRAWLAILALALVAAVVAATIAASSAGAGDDQHYVVVLDNAFGLTVGSDVRSSGVPVGRVKSLDVQRRTARALVTIAISRPEFAGFHKDVFCKVQPQSLIGEYYMDCDPGTSPLPAPATIPVTQTSDTIPPDVVLDILRRPARERFGLILTELGMGVAGRGEDLNAAIRRAIPALGETDRVLKILGDNRETLRQLTRDADRVLAGLARNRSDVARFVRTAGDTTAATSARDTQLAAAIQRLPAFLRELRPTLADLGTAAARQTPALADLRAAAPDLTTLLKRLGPFADSARPAVRGLGRASDTGIVAVREAASTVKRLRGLGSVSTEPMRNLRFVLENVNDRDNAVERNPLSPSGKGFTGLEALLQYFFTQSQAINIFDSKSYILKLGLLVNQCTQYTNAQTARDDPARTKACNQWLGPNQPGVTTAIQDATSRGTASTGTAPTAPSQDEGDGAPPARTTTPASPGATAPAPAATAPPQPPQLLPEAGKLLNDVIPGITDKLPPLRPSPRDAERSRADQQGLLDYLLGP